VKYGKSSFAVDVPKHLLWRSGILTSIQRQENTYLYAGETMTSFIFFDA